MDTSGYVCSTTGSVYLNDCAMGCYKETLLTTCLSTESEVECKSRCDEEICLTGCTPTIDDWYCAVDGLPYPSDCACTCSGKTTA